MANNAYITRYNADSGLMEYFSGASWYEVPDEAYTPDDAGNWNPAPATVAAALDQLAARVQALEDAA